MLEKVKLIATDILGLLLIIASILFGWLPGIGGIPLLIAGLGVLAINHDWAKQLLIRVKTEGLRISNAFFKEHQTLMLIYDVVAILLVAGATAVIIQSTGDIIRGIAIVGIFIGLGLFIGNRKRLIKVQKIFLKNKR